MSDKTYFQQGWHTIPQFKDWLSAGKESTKAHYERCSKIFELSNMGMQVVKRHAAGKFTVFFSCIML